MVRLGVVIIACSLGFEERVKEGARRCKKGDSGQQLGIVTEYKWGGGVEGTYLSKL